MSPGPDGVAMSTSPPPPPPPPPPPLPVAMSATPVGANAFVVHRNAPEKLRQK
jgi:hypothetical protein